MTEINMSEKAPTYNQIDTQNEKGMDPAVLIPRKDGRIVVGHADMSSETQDGWVRTYFEDEGEGKEKWANKLGLSDEAQSYLAEQLGSDGNHEREIVNPTVAKELGQDAVGLVLFNEAGQSMESEETEVKEPRVDSPEDMARVEDIKTIVFNKITEIENAYSGELPDGYKGFELDEFIDDALAIATIVQRGGGVEKSDTLRFVRDIVEAAHRKISAEKARIESGREKSGEVNAYLEEGVAETRTLDNDDLREEVNLEVERISREVGTEISKVLSEDYSKVNTGMRGIVAGIAAAVNEASWGVIPNDEMVKSILDMTPKLRTLVTERNAHDRAIVGEINMLKERLAKR